MKNKKARCDLMINKKPELKRININLPIDLIQRVGDYANSKGLNVTSAYIVLLNTALDQNETINNLPIMLDLIKNEISKLPKSND